MRVLTEVFSMLPSLSTLKNFVPLLEAVELCLPRKLYTPAAVLTYSGIDAAAWVNSDKPSTDRTAFKQWVADYLLRAKTLPCSADDLYSARCALLHTLSSDSDMTNRGSARVIWYAWKPAPLAPLQKLAAFPTAPNPIALYGDDLVEGFTLGLVALEGELTRDYSGDKNKQAWQAQARKKANLVLESVPWPPP
jgi:hypothetical protein